jgi:hypothetical protein
MTQLHELSQINAKAHIDTVHPHGLEWPESFGPGELQFLSQAVFGRVGHEDAAVAYITKELAQLAEIERHVSAVLAYVMSELQKHDDELAAGFELHDALSCFAAEELHHANMFYRYVRLLSGRDFRYPENLFSQRVGLYLGEDSPYVKLAALCCSAYVGESVITVFEHRAKSLDPEMKFFFTRLLHVHGLDEARHIHTDHFVFEHVIPSLKPAQRRRMRQILEGTEALNGEVATRFEAHAKEVFGVDYTEGNWSHDTQLLLARTFRGIVLGGDEVRPVDEAINDEHRALLERFSSARHVHA